MKLKNKETGEVVEIIMPIKNGDGWNIAANSLAELNKEWEDYEEPKNDGLDNIITLVESYSIKDRERYPEEIAEKLKAWKRLKDKGFRFKNWTRNHTGTIDIFCSWESFPHNHCTNKDLDLLFGGEE